MLDDTPAPGFEDADYVEFFPTGKAVIGAYRCADCGYGVTLRSVLPLCPMCSGSSWEQAPWSPFSHVRAQ